jgi:hypothetical protein
VNRYNIALSLVALAAIPLFHVSGWLGSTALVAIYVLLTRLANNDLDRLSGTRSASPPGVVRPHRTTPAAAHHRSYLEGMEIGDPGPAVRPQFLGRFSL